MSYQRAPTSDDDPNCFHYQSYEEIRPSTSPLISPSQSSLQTPSSQFSTPLPSSTPYDSPSPRRSRPYSRFSISSFTPSSRSRSSFAPFLESKSSFSSHSSTPLTHAFEVRAQIWLQLKSILFRDFLSVIISVLLIITLLTYQRSGVLARTQKHWFTAIHTGLSVALSLNLASSLKAIADIFRWRVLASPRYGGGHTAMELDLVLGLNSYQKSLRLLVRWMKKPKWFVMLAGWIGIGVGVQVGVALLGLTHNLEEPDAAVRFGSGLVNATNMTYYALNGVVNDNPGFLGQGYRSNVLGEVGDAMLNWVGSNDSSSSEFPDVEISPLEGKGSTYKYRFVESVWRPDKRPLLHTTNRSVSVNTTCHHSYIINGATGLDNITLYPAPQITLWGNPDMYNILVPEKSPYGWLKETGYTIPGTTLYLGPSLHADSASLRYMNYNNVNCGPRCGFVEIFRFITTDEENAATENNPAKGDFFQCLTEVSKVINAENWHHNLADHVALLASTAIANKNVYNIETEMQYNVYTSASRWAIWTDPTGAPLTGPNAHILAENFVSRYAIASIAMLDRTNPLIELLGERLFTGSVLEVKWQFVAIILGSIILVQILVGFWTIYVARNVYCKDDSFLGTARLLKAVVDEMGKEGSAATAEQIWNWFGERKMRYGVAGGEEGNGEQRLDILMGTHEEAPPEGNKTMIRIGTSYA